MSRAQIKATRPLLFSNTSSLGVGSTWYSDPVDVSAFKSFTGICDTASGNMTFALQQSAVGSLFNVSSGVAFIPGIAVCSWIAIGAYARLGVTSVTSLAGTMRLHVYGVPI